MGLKASFKQKLERATVKTELDQRGQSARDRDYPDIVDHIENKSQALLEAPKEFEANLTPSQKISIAMRGKTNRMKHGIFSKRSPSMMCNNCYLVRSVMDENYQILNAADVKCPYYKQDSACIFLCQALSCNLRSMEDVKVLMEETVELDMQRIQMARAIEIYEGGGVLDQSLDMAIERMGKNMLMLKDFYLELDDRKKPSGENRQGILSKLLEQEGVETVDATIEDVKDGTRGTGSKES